MEEKIKTKKREKRKNMGKEQKIFKVLLSRNVRFVENAVSPLRTSNSK